MADDTLKFSELNPLPAYDANKIIAIENNPPGATEGWYGYIALTLNPASPSNALLVTQKAIDDNVVHKTGNVVETITGNKTFNDNIYGKKTVSAEILEAGFSGKNGQIILRDTNGIPFITFDTATNSYFFSGQPLQNMGDPINAQDVSTKNYTVSNQKNIYYFGNNGSDSKDGKSLQERKLTADGAITAANGQSPPPSGTNRVNISDVDGGDNTKFSLTGGGFVSLIAPYSGFGVITTSTSPNGIIIADGYAAQLGFIRHALEGSGDQAGIIVKCGAGANATHVDIRQIFNSTIYDDVLFQSEGDAVFAEIEDIRQGNSRDSTAIYVANGVLFLRGNHRIVGKIIVGIGKTAYIDTMYFDGDIAVENNGTLYISGKYWNGDIVTAGSGSTIITDFDTHIIP